MIIEMAISMENGSVCVFNDAIRCYTKYIHIFLNYGTVTEVKIRFANERARSKPLNRKTLPNNEQRIKKTPHKNRRRPGPENALFASGNEWDSLGWLGRPSFSAALQAPATTSRNPDTKRSTTENQPSAPSAHGTRKRHQSFSVAAALKKSAAWRPAASTIDAAVKSLMQYNRWKSWKKYLLSWPSPSTFQCP